MVTGHPPHSSHVAPAQRHSPGRPGPICGGHSLLPKGRAIRCYGFVSADGRFTHCTRPEHAGQLQEAGAGTFPHRLDGACKCGRQHGLAPVSMPQASPVLNSERTARAQGLWVRARLANGTIVETYLRARGLTLPVPATLRFGILRHEPSGRDLPAMVAAVHRWPAGEPLAVHRTFLAPDGSDKADVPDTKLSYGPIRGGEVWLAPPGETLLICEGIETALSGQQETDIPAWAAIRSSNMPYLVLPQMPLARLVIIAADGDEVGFGAAQRAAERWDHQGRRVKIAVPSAGKDLNDLLRGVA